MDIKNEMLDYPILPLAKLNIIERMFRSYIGNNNNNNNNITLIITLSIY